jgi:cyclopropane fatty-acyl-phospholipid synthase-like methyltransferase
MRWPVLNSMNAESHTNYTSPAGKEFTLAAARFAGINPASRVLDIGCGYGEAACNLASEFRSRVTALDISEENIRFGRDLAAERGISHLITFTCADVLTAEAPDEPFDLILAEGGVLSFVGRREGLELAARWLARRGYFAFSDLTLLSERGVPAEVRAIFEDDHYHYESEKSYRALVTQAGFDVAFLSLAPPSGWENYYAHMSRRLEDNTGFFADPAVKLAFHKEIDVFYRLDGFRYVGYLFCIARKKD